MFLTRCVGRFKRKAYVVTHNDEVFIAYSSGKFQIPTAPSLHDIKNGMQQKLRKSFAVLF